MAAPVILQASILAEVSLADSVSIALTGTTTGSTIIILGTAYNPGGDPNPISVTDDQGNGAYTVKTSPTIAGVANAFVAYKQNIIGTGGIHNFTVNPNGNPNGITFCVLEVADLGAADPFDQQASASGTSTSPDTGNTPITTVPDEILVAALRAGADQTGGGSIVVGGSGWTQRFEELDDNTFNASEGDSKIVSSIGAYNAQWTQTNSGNWTAIICTFGLGGSSTVRIQNHARFRNDDGSETTATWQAAEDANSSGAVNTNVRLRIETDTSGVNPPSEQLKLQYRRVDSGDEWKDVD